MQLLLLYTLLSGTSVEDPPTGVPETSTRACITRSPSRPRYIVGSLFWELASRLCIGKIKKFKRIRNNYLLPHVHRRYSETSQRRNDNVRK